MAQKLYLLVRKDIPVAQQGVQMAHVAAKFANATDGIDWDQMPFVCVTVDDRDELVLHLRRASQRDEEYQYFLEAGPIGMTAGAVLHDGNLFDKLPLWDPMKAFSSQLEQAAKST